MHKNTVKKAVRTFALRDQAQELIANLQDATLAHSKALGEHLNAERAFIGDRPDTAVTLAATSEKLDVAYAAILRALTHGIEGDGK